GVEKNGVWSVRYTARQCHGRPNGCLTSDPVSGCRSCATAASVSQFTQGIPVGGAAEHIRPLVVLTFDPGERDRAEVPCGGVDPGEQGGQLGFVAAPLAGRLLDDEL